MPGAPHPRDHEAAEYVLGTLTPEERANFARGMASDPTLAAAARFWEERLAGLGEEVSPVEPRAAVWAALLGRLDASPTVVPFPEPSVAGLRRSRSLWRVAALATGSLAAALAIFIASERLHLWPAQPTLVAVVNRSGELPALIIRVDTAAGVLQVRSIAAEVPAGRSLELWSIVGSQAARSLGVIDGATRLRLRDGDTARLEGATLAVTIEPKGGSPTGAATGPVVYSGKLVPETP
jgi:anti-sigma-K factor RskA